MKEQVSTKNRRGGERPRNPLFLFVDSSPVKKFVRAFLHMAYSLF